MDRPSVQAIVLDVLRLGKVMQLATESSSGPRLSHLWYASSPDGTEIVFISKAHRRHSAEIRSGGRVGGAIVAMQLEGFGQCVTGLTFFGYGAEVSADRLDAAFELYFSRWPAAELRVCRQAIVSGQSDDRLYLVQVAEYVLFDEVFYPDEPRQVWVPQ